jgi:hypothetical protein
LPDKVHDCLLYFLFFNFNLHSFYFLFHSYYFYRSFVFQFIRSNIIFHVFFFVTILLICNFFCWPFC